LCLQHGGCGCELRVTRSEHQCPLGLSSAPLPSSWLQGVRLPGVASAPDAGARVTGYCVGTSLVSFLRGLDLLHLVRGFVMAREVKAALRTFVTYVLSKAVSPGYV
jgi:hypothetical protein